jgi:hypothetical protein
LSRARRQSLLRNIMSVCRGCDARHAQLTRPSSKDHLPLPLSLSGLRDAGLRLRLEPLLLSFLLLLRFSRLPLLPRERDLSRLRLRLSLRLLFLSFFLCLLARSSSEDTIPTALFATRRQK